MSGKIGRFSESKKHLPKVEEQRKKTELLSKEVTRILDPKRHLPSSEFMDVKEEFWKSAYGKYVESQDSQLYKLEGDYRDFRKKDIQAIMSRAEVFTSSTDLPSINYTVEFNPDKRIWPLSKLLHADKITITDNKKNKVIAYSRRYMAYAAFITKFSGQQPKFDYTLGDKRTYVLDDKVLFEYASDYLSGYDSEREWELIGHLSI